MDSRYLPVLGLLACQAYGHGILTSPIPRDGTAIGNGNKLTSGSARDANCGGTENGDPGFTANGNQPKVAYINGSTFQVAWKLTIPHPQDNIDIGVRVALHISDSDSFNNNILIGCLSGDPGCDDQNSAGVYINRASAGAESRLVTLPKDKVCSYCVLQWIWEAKSDGGHYVQCVDIAITANGLLPNFNNLELETDTNGNGLPDGVAGGAPNPNDSSSDNSGTTTAIAVVVVLIVVGVLGFVLYKRRAGKPGKASSQAASGLPPGWTSAIDPSSGRTYYTNAATGETTWDMPQGGMAVPPPQVAPPAALPPGWQSASDPSSGKTYYINSVTGQTTWEHPG